MRSVSLSISFSLLLSLGLALPAGAATNPAAQKELDLVRTHLGAGENDKAIEAGERAVKADPQSAEAYHALGNAYGDKARKASVFTMISWGKKCRDAWKKASELDPKSTRIRMDLIRFHMLAPGIAGGDKDEARRQAEEVAKLDATDGHIALGIMADIQKAPEKAEAEYKKAYELGGEGGFRALSSHYLRRERYPDAEALCRSVLEKQPDEALALYFLGRIATLSGKDMEKGLVSFDRFLELPEKPNNPSHADGLWRKGLLYEKLGQKDQAVLTYQAALKQEPAHAGAKKELKRLNG